MKLLKYLKWYFLATAILFVLLVIVGIVNGYSPVPHWDMWDGYLGSYVKTTDGDYWQWIAQHNEHRIFFSRILFWIDLKFFSGASLFLLPMNFLLLAVFVYLLIQTAKKLDLFESYGSDRYAIIISLLVIICFSWMQNNNLDWGFQSQFLAAYLFPFSAFLALYQFQVTGRVNWFVGALILGVLSAGTMANGVLALPILFILSLFLRVKLFYSLIILLTGVVVNALYFWNFQSNLGHGSLTETLLNHPTDFLLYILTYLGNPFHYINIYYFNIHHLFISQAFGAIFIVVAIGAFFYVLFKLPVSNHKRLLLVLFAYILYVGGTAFGTAGGRAIFGLHQAIESRYTTPTLFAWGALLVVLFYLMQDYLRDKSKLFVIFAMVPLLFFSVQLNALNERKEEFFDRKVAALALEMGVRDEVYIQKIFPFVDWLEEIVVKPKDRNLSIFGSPEIVDVEKKIGHTLNTIFEVKSLVGHLDVQAILEKEPEFIRITGWIFDKKRNQPAAPMWVVNRENKIVGFVLVGFARNDVASVLKRNNAKLSGFKGYIKSGETGELLFVDRVTGESLSLTIEDISKFPIFTNWLDNTEIKDNLAKVGNIDKSKVISWDENATYNNLPIIGFQAFGSYINGDSHQGEVTLHMKKGNVLIYKTGPTNKGQYITIKNMDEETLLNWVLPINREWVALTLDDHMLPDEFVVTVSDTGNGWGQWSAILLAE